MHVPSPILNERKPFDKTELEDYIEEVFFQFEKPMKKNTSFEAGLLSKVKLEKDDRLDTSCVLEF